MQDHLIEDVIGKIKDYFGARVRARFEPNGGNLGDVLISAGTICALDRSRIQWSMLQGRPLEDADYDIIIYGGGGNLVPQYDGAARFIKRVAAVGKPLVILPHTIRGHLDALSLLRNGMIFCRDSESAQFVRQHLTLPCYQAHDMALSLDFRMFGLWSVMDIEHAISSRAAAPSTLVAFRGDGESSGSGISQHPSNIDMSVAAKAVGSEKSSILVQAALFLGALARYERIYTDRLHVAIAGALLGRQVHMFDNNYGKNRAIFETSLRDQFRHVHFHASVADYKATFGAFG